MQPIPETSDTTDSFSLLSSLYRKEDKQILEWSVQLNLNGIIPRSKPTLFLYPGTGFASFKQLNKNLSALNCPTEVIDIQRATFETAMYQGLRVPGSNTSDKCLYIHEQGQSFIHAYRWQNEKHYDRCYYRYQNNSTLSEVAAWIHPELQDFFSAIVDGSEFNKLCGFWTREYNDCVQEVYLSFPSAPRLQWVLNSFRILLSNSVFSEITTLENLRFKNIGFNTTQNSSTPEVTFYFLLPITDRFPVNCTQLMSMTHEYFRKN